MKSRDASASKNGSKFSHSPTFRAEGADLPPPSLLYGQPDRKISVFWQLLFAPEYWTSCGLISSFNSGFNQISQSGTILCKRNFTRSSWLESGIKDMFGFWLVYIFTHLKVTFCQFFKLSALKNCSYLPSMVQDGWVALPFLVCSFVCPAMVTPDQISTFFFKKYIQALKPHIKPVPLKSKQYQVILTQYHQVPTSTAFYCFSTIKYHSQKSDFPLSTWWDEHSST